VKKTLSYLSVRVPYLIRAVVNSVVTTVIRKCRVIVKMTSASSTLVKKCDHRAEIINNAGYLGTDFYNRRKADKSTRRLLKNHIQTPYKYILFPKKDRKVIEWRYLSLHYDDWDGMHPELVGGCIYINQTYTGDPEKSVRRYSEGISVHPNEPMQHSDFYKDVWKNLDNAWFAPITHSFENYEATRLEFGDFSHLISYLSKYEYYFKLKNEHDQVHGHRCSQHMIEFNINTHIELFVSRADTYTVELTPFNKYSTIISNIGIDSSLTNSDDNMSPVSQPWTLKKLCWFFLKNYYEDHIRVLKNVLPPRLLHPLSCIKFDRYFVKWSYEPPSNFLLRFRSVMREVRQEIWPERRRPYRFY
jgi:hypothetical protein